MLLTCGVSQANGEKVLGQLGANVGEPSLLLGRLNGVSSIVAKAKQAVGESVLGELVAHFLGRLNSLVGNAQSSDGNDIVVDDSTGATLVGIANLPGLSVLQLSGRALARVVQSLAMDFVGVGVGAEDPEVTGASVEIEVDGLSWGSNLHWCNVLYIRRVVGARSSNDGAGALTGSQLGVQDLLPGSLMLRVVTRLVALGKVVGLIKNVTRLLAVLHLNAESTSTLSGGGQGARRGGNH